MNISTAMDISMHFSFLDDARADFYSGLPDVAMSFTAIRAMRGYFNSCQYRAPYAGELIFLDAFYRSRCDSPDQYSTASIATNDEHISTSIAELMSAHSELNPQRVAPATVGEAFTTALEAAYHRKSHEFSSSGNRLFVASTNELARLKAISKGYVPMLCDNGCCIAQNSYSQPYRKIPAFSTAYGTAIVYLRGNADQKALEEFTKAMAENSKAEIILTSAGKDAFGALYSLANNLEINANELLPYNFDGTRDIFAVISDALFSNLLFGECAVTVIARKKNLAEIYNVATGLGLGVCTAISISNVFHFKVLLNGNVISDLGSDVLSVITTKNYADVELADVVRDKSIEPSDVLPVFSISDSGECVYSVSESLNSSSYEKTVFALVSPLITAAYSGANLTNSVFHYSIRCALNVSDNECCAESYRALAALYRVLTELEIPVDDYEVKITDGDPKITVLLRETSIGEKASFVSFFDKKLLIKKVFDNSSAPDLSIIKAIIKG